MHIDVYEVTLLKNEKYKVFSKVVLIYLYSSIYTLNSRNKVWIYNNYST